MSYVVLERGIPGRGSLDGPCEVMGKCRRYIDPCPGGRATCQAVFRREQPQPARTKPTGVLWRMRFWELKNTIF